MSSPFVPPGGEKAVYSGIPGRSDGSDGVFRVGQKNFEKKQRLHLFKPFPRSSDLPESPSGKPYITALQDNRTEGMEILVNLQM